MSALISPVLCSVPPWMRIESRWPSACPVTGYGHNPEGPTSVKIFKVKRRMNFRCGSHQRGDPRRANADCSAGNGKGRGGGHEQDDFVRLQGGPSIPVPERRERSWNVRQTALQGFLCFLILHIRQPEGEGQPNAAQSVTGIPVKEDSVFPCEPSLSHPPGRFPCQGHFRSHNTSTRRLERPGFSV